MFHKAVKLVYREGTVLEVTFSTGEIKRFDMAAMFSIYVSLEALRDRDLFLSGQLLDYGIIWNDMLDVDAETIYEEGELVGTVSLPGDVELAAALKSARALAAMSQKDLAAATGIDQSDISKIERGLANPSVATLGRLAKGLNMRLSISFLKADDN